jgi:hypothetical protein
VQLSVSEIIPRKEAVLRSQGFKKGMSVKEGTLELLDKAFEIFSNSADPESLFLEVSVSKFGEIFRWSGRNAPDTPLQHIFPRSDKLTLFALTMGSKISTKINEFFNNSDFALGALLDSVASLAAGNATEVLEDHFANGKPGNNNRLPDYTVLSYSPGYCGWHISGQEKLFQFLRPEQIGITLNDSFLMTPIKSVTGVLVGGKKEIHIFKSNYPFCSYCKDFSCVERIKKLKSM